MTHQMRFREVEGMSRFSQTRWPSRFAIAWFNFRSLLCLIGVGFLCFTSFYFGAKTMSDSNQPSVVKPRFDAREIEDLLASVKERARRDAKREWDAAFQNVKKVSKRSAEQPAVITRTFDGGVTYTRWGRKDCGDSNHNSRVYTGIAAGSHYTHTGGGSNILCLTYNVTYRPGTFVDGYQDSSYLYGIEYRGAGALNSLFDFSKIGNNYMQHAVPCAICMAHAKRNQLMIPGTNICPDGWTEEYNGYIMSSAHSHKHSTDYICVDRQPQVVPGSGGDQAGGLLYIAEVSCPSLQCEPYVNAREVACVVCTI